MSIDDTKPMVSWQDVPAALGLLTRLPIHVATDRAMTRGASAAWAYPLVGLVVAAITIIIVSILGWFGIGGPIAMAFALLIPIIVTGAMHEDGLADTVDGLWGGWTKERRLEIMKDSHIGTYGVLALIISLLIKFSALLAIGLNGSLWSALVVAAVLSRANMVAVMTGLRNARAGGLSRSVGRPEHATAYGGYAIAIGITLIAAPWPAPALSLIAVLTALTCAVIAKIKIDGQTGDILGATQQVSEAVILVSFAALFN